MNSKIFGLLGFASKAGKLAYGMANTLEAIKKGKSLLVIAAGDISPNSNKEISFFCNKYNVKLISLSENMEAMSSAIGRRCGIISVNNKGFADAISEQYGKADI